MPGVVEAILFVVGFAVGLTAAVVVASAVPAGIALAANSLFSKKEGSKAKRAAVSGGGGASVSELSREIIENKKSTVEYIPVVYGRHKVGGIQVFEEVSNDYLYLVVVFCEGPINSIETVYIDGVDVLDSRFSGLVEVYEFFGTDDQSVTEWFHYFGTGAAPNFIASGAPGWTANHRLLGCAGVALRLTKNTDIFPRIPIITGIVLGRKVYDPRDLTTKYTTNPALCIRDYYLNTRFGARIPVSRIDESSFTDAANYFEQTTDYGNGSQSRFVLNGIVNTSVRVWDNIEDLMLACNSLPKRVNGKHGILPLKSETVAFAFTDDNVVGGIRVDRLGKRFKKNKVNLQFINPNTNWQADLYILADTTYKTQDNEIDLVTEIDLPHVIDWYQASHLARIGLRQSRLEDKFSFIASHEALKVEVGDLVTLTHSLYGFSAKQMRVTSISLEPDGTVGIGAEEYDAEVYTVASANAPNLGSSTTFGSPFDIDPPGTPTVDQSFGVNSAGFVVNVVELSWSAPVSAQVARYIVEYRLSSDTAWIKAGEPQTKTFNITDVVAGTYDFAVSAVNTVGRVSTRATRSSIPITNNTDIPDDVTNFTHEFASDNQIVLKWDKNPDVTVGGGYRIRVSSNTTGASWADFPQLNILVPERETTVTLGRLQGTYMIKAETLAGVQSATPATIQVLLPDDDQWALVTSITESPTFGGVHTNTETSTNTLTLQATSSGGYYLTGTYETANATLWDSFLSNMDDYNTVAIDSWTGSSIELLGTFPIKVTRDSSGTLSNTAANWDSFTGNVDDYVTQNIDDLGGRSTLDVKHYLATSTQGSTGAFTDYQILQSLETVARYLKFKTTIQSSANTENCNISDLAWHVYMRRRNESNWNVSASSTGATVAFSAPFYAMPTIQAFPFNANASDRVTVTTSEAGRTGFSVYYYTSSGAATSGRFSWTAFGYGKEKV